MPKVKKEPCLTWDEAPDTIGPEELAKILGIGVPGARAIFEKTNFPRIKGIGNTRKADKNVARLYIQGINVKGNPKVCIEQMILLELRKLNNNFEERRMNFDEQKAI